MLRSNLYYLFLNNTTLIIISKAKVTKKYVNIIKKHVTIMITETSRKEFLK